ncbi:hypothetical protein BH20ACI2_BH20ACI2_05420 [soil metagenome]
MRSIQKSFFGAIFLVLSGCACNETNSALAIEETLVLRNSRSGDERLAFQLFQAMNDITRSARLRPPSSFSDGAEREIRLWTNVGSYFEKILVIRGDENHRRLIFFDIDRSRDSIRFKRKVLNTPSAGWYRVLLALNKQNISIPLGLQFDRPLKTGRDEGFILIEVFDGGQYDFVYYGQETSSADGLKLLSLCDALEAELGVDLDCRGVRTSP